MYLSGDKRDSNTTTRYMDDILNIDNIKFDNMKSLFSITVKAATLIFLSGRGFVIPSSHEGKIGNRKF